MIELILAIIGGWFIASIACVAILVLFRSRLAIIFTTLEEVPAE